MAIITKVDLASVENSKAGTQAHVAQQVTVTPTYLPTRPEIQQQQQHLKVTDPYGYATPKTKWETIDAPWPDWSTCKAATAFQSNCDPRPATCQAVSEDIGNNHGIGNALIVSFLKAAKALQAANPDCAPILEDINIRTKSRRRTNNTSSNNNNNEFEFHLLDFVQEPSVATKPDDKCLMYSITQPREAVANKVRGLSARFLEGGAADLPLVALQIRTGWSDETRSNVAGWDALGSCGEYKEQFKNRNHRAVSEVDVEAMILDTAAAADRAFGANQWKVYVASDAPGIRQFVKQRMEARAAGPILWVEGTIGHNAFGGNAMSKDEKIDTSVNAFVDVLMMSQAKMLVCTSSKFPAAANMRSMCPQRYLVLRGHPRHDLAKAGRLLNLALGKYQSTGDPVSVWVPELAEESQQNFFNALPDGNQSMCIQAPNPVRACFCLLKLGHA